jgi:A/G-specific adenine glycosylase
LVVSDDNDDTIKKELQKGIWQNLYEFPLIETETEESFDYIVERLRKIFLLTTL